MTDYKNMPLRKPMARWSLIFGGILTLIYTFVWIVTDREPPSQLVSIVITFISAPPAVYGITSSWEAIKKPRHGFGYEEPQYPQMEETDDGSDEG